MNMNNMGDRIVMFGSMGDIGGVEVLSRAEFLSRYPDDWRNLLASGLSMYIGGNGRLLAFNEAEMRLNDLAA